MIKRIVSFVRRLLLVILYVGDRSFSLKPYELKAINAWRDSLSEEAKEILDRQMEAFDLYARMGAYKNKYVGMIRHDDDHLSSWTSQHKFKLFTDDENSIASVKMRINRRTIRCNILLYRGILSAIEFNRPPKEVFPQGTKQEGIEIISVDTIMDPMASGLRTEPLTDKSKLYGKLSEWNHEFGLSDLKHPVVEGLQKKIAKFYKTKFPQDYMEVVSQTEGLHVGHCRINGLGEIRTFIMPKTDTTPECSEGCLLVIAEIEGMGELGVCHYRKDGKIYYYDSEMLDPVFAGLSLYEIIDEELRAIKAGGSIREKYNGTYLP